MDSSDAGALSAGELNTGSAAFMPVCAFVVVSRLTTLVCDVVLVPLIWG